MFLRCVVLSSAKRFCLHSKRKEHPFNQSDAVSQSRILSHVFLFQYDAWLKIFGGICYISHYLFNLKKRLKCIKLKLCLDVKFVKRFTLRGFYIAIAEMILLNKLRKPYSQKMSNPRQKKFYPG